MFHHFDGKQDKLHRPKSKLILIFSVQIINFMSTKIETILNTQYSINDIYVCF